MSKHELGEQLSRGGRAWINFGRGVRRWYKRLTAKKRRQIERRDPENAPKGTRWAGWAD